MSRLARPTRARPGRPGHSACDLALIPTIVFELRRHSNMKFAILHTKLHQDLIFPLRTQCNSTGQSTLGKRCLLHLTLIHIFQICLMIKASTFEFTFFNSIHRINFIFLSFKCVLRSLMKSKPSLPCVNLPRIHRSSDSAAFELVGSCRSKIIACSSNPQISR